MVFRVIRYLVLGVLCLIGKSVAAADAPAADVGGMAFFETKIHPIFQERCVKCHGGEKTKSGLNLTWRTGLLTGGKHGAAVNLAEPAKSLLLDMLSYRDEQHEMPPDGKLPAEQIALLADWIAKGAPMPDVPPKPIAEEVPASPYNNQINEKSRNWWAYRKVSEPKVPAVEDPAWNGGPIDAFIYADLKTAGLSPAPEADRRTLIRRVTYDLTGLPPSPREVEAFVSDPDPNAYEHLIDRLLASPHHGETWGRHWLDIVRYAETNGYERDNPKPYIWRYRDYVIDAFNKDKPYDRFLREQLAGDELPDGGAEGIAATGFYRLGLWNDEPVDKAQERYDVLDSVIATTAESMLGLTMGCARCHDHKIDPLPQKDYYRFLSFFDNVTDMDTTEITRSILEGREAAEYAASVDRQREWVGGQDLRVRGMESEFIATLRRSDPKALPALQPSGMSGLRYRFYRGTWDKLPDFDALKHDAEGAVEGDYFDLGARRRNEAFGIVIEGTLEVHADSDYLFYLDSDDGSRLKIDGRTVVEHDGVHILGREKNARFSLKAGSHAIRLDYFQRAEAMGLTLEWSGAGFERRPLTTPSPGVDVPQLIAARGDQVVAPGFSGRYANARKLSDFLRRHKTSGGKVAAAVREYGATPRKTFVQSRGNPNAPGDEVQPGFPQVLGFADPPPATPTNGESTGRRTQLANWIASPENPLTARVMVNRIWQHHFGRGIVRSPNDFGQAGNLPTHPELLDWLAAEFVRGGWSMKHMHRVILLSRAYRMSSEGNAVNHAKDPANDHFWRMDMRRLSAEELRDSILAVNGSINLDMHGESVYPPMPQAVLQTSSMPATTWKSSPPAQHARRSIYIHVKRSLLTPLLSDFDLADTDTSCPVRFSTTQPSQALNLLNSEFANEQAVVFARRLRQEAPDDAARVRLAFNLVAGHNPASDELQRGMDFLGEMKTRHGLKEDVALDRFALLMLNLNAFLYLD